MNLSTHNFQRILLIKPSSLGDIIHALPLLNGLRARYSHARISWLLNTEYVDLLKDHPQLDEVIPFDRQKFKTLLGSVRMTFKLGGFAAGLRRRQFDLAVDVQGLFRSGLIAFASGAVVRLGFNPSREGSGMFYSHRVPIPEPDMHAADKNYLPAKVLGFEQVPLRFHLPVSQDRRESIRQKLADKNVGTDQPYAVVVPGSRWETKNWRPERFSAAANYIQKKLDLKVVLSGSSAESDLCQLIAQTCKPPVVELVGQIDLAEMIALLDGASLVLCNDSAPLHIAAALGKPLVTIFGPTNPRRTGPYDRLDHVLQAKLPCIPCYYRRLGQCPIQHQCMADIDVEQVNRALATAVSKAASNAPGPLPDEFSTEQNPRIAISGCPDRLEP